MSSDPFADTPAADPFAGDPPPTADAPPAEEIPTVDREGEPVEPEPAKQEGTFDPISQSVAPAVPPADAPLPEAPAPEPETQEAGQPPEPPETPEAPPATDEPSEVVAAPEEAPQTPEDPGTGDVTPAVPAQPDATPQPQSTAPPAPANGERPPGPRGGKGEMRHYKLLYQTGPAQWTEFDLNTVDQQDTGIKVVTVEEEIWFEARNNEHANRLGFTIVGRPKDGARIFPVPRGAYKPKTVKPAPPAPARERVVIS